MNANRSSMPPRKSVAHTVRAHNIAVNAENAIHHDDGARALGFSGGLVSGVTVYAYMTRPLVERFGADALAGTAQRAAFFAPVYDGDALRFELEPNAPRTLSPEVAVRALKTDAQGQDQPVAVWQIERKPLPEPGPLPDWSPRPPGAERPLVSWEAILPGKAFHGFLWQPTAPEQRAWCDSVQDDLPLYSQGNRPICHPGWVLQQANFALGREFRMNPWIHVSSRITWRQPPRVGESIEVRAVPLETWEKHGDRYVLLRVAMAAQGRVLLEADHKAIVAVAPR